MSRKKQSAKRDPQPWGRSRKQGGQIQPSNRTVKEDEQVKWELGRQSSAESHNRYDELELRPGGTGKQGDQQEFGQDREPRRDKSHNDSNSDKMHT